MRPSKTVGMLLFLVVCDATFLPAVLPTNSRQAAADWRWWRKQDLPPDQTPGVRPTYYAGHVWPPQPRPLTRPATFTDQYYANRYWPYPFSCQDRSAVRVALDQQTANGWMAETTLYDQHYDTETNTINQAGRMHLRWILLYAPPAYRAAFIATAGTAEESQARLASTQMAALEMTGPDNACPIMLRATQQMGTSAEERDLVRRQWLGTIPSPRINYVGPPGGASGASGGR